jgi:hypothetical protein
MRIRYDGVDRARTLDVGPVVLVHVHVDVDVQLDDDDVDLDNDDDHHPDDDHRTTGRAGNDRGRTARSAAGRGPGARREPEPVQLEHRLGDGSRPRCVVA